MNSLTTLKSCLPSEYHPEGAESGVLLIHGYTGTPRDMKYLAGRLGETGRGYSIPRLPGAGTDMSDLSTTNRRDWKRRVYDSWLDLKARYDDISIVGYSMGGLLALHLATEVRPTKLALLAPAVRIARRSLAATPLVAPFAGLLPKLKTDWKPAESDDSDELELGRRYWSKRDIRSAAQLYRLIRETRAELGKVSCPVMGIISLGDPTVPPESLEILDKGLPGGLSRSLVVKKCQHDVPQGADREAVARGVIQWLNEGNLSGKALPA